MAEALLGLPPSICPALGPTVPPQTPVPIPSFTPVLVLVTLPSTPVPEPEGPTQRPHSPGSLLA